MPVKPKRPCKQPGCRALTDDGWCDAHRPAPHARYDDRRGSAASRGYNSRWRKARETFLCRHPLCAECERQDRVTAAEVVDHIIPHRGDQALFWDTSNWQSLCRSCHSAKTAAEDGGFGNARAAPAGGGGVKV
ncbi:HNH endonuclease [Jeongeupia sp. USM3]|uniref:HNH endonuclease n=1 Tax=Jeongeupia sp. USM3 TaxID=1906741 RepID=UPI0009F269E9|nr:HNH endonuclease [Jeongeupia sp. USM3]